MTWYFDLSGTTMSIYDLSQAAFGDIEQGTPPEQS